ncbi:MAG: ribosome small subunit-dependent GTPase A [Kineosporiaceae bacterium]
MPPPRRRPPIDEQDIRVRAPRRGSRPRTKDRPGHLDATAGWVVAIDRGRYRCLIPPPMHDPTGPGDASGAPAGGDGSPASADGSPQPPPREVVAVRARELRPADVAVGDAVALVGDLGGAEGALARLVRVSPRRTSLRRTADDADPVERVVVANADQVCVVVAAADPEPQPRLIDRALVAAWDAGADPLLCVTKTDLADPAALLHRYADVDLRSVTVAAAAGAGLAELRRALAGRVTALVGSSGVGKSTLVNALTGSHRRTGGVNLVTGRGRHTSVSAVALAVTGGRGWVVDTPGLRSFGLAHVSPDRLLHAFDDLEPASEDCPRGCDHDNPDCHLDPYVADGHAGPGGPRRLESYRRLLRALRATP